MDPTRSSESFHRCLCLLEGIDGDEQCRVEGLPMDMPFCVNCEDRHPEFAHREDVRVTCLTLDAI